VVFLLVEAKLKVTGEVQGVGYRFHCRQLARKFNVTGYADNLADGSVEVYACGEEKDVDAFVYELRKTKPLDARIDTIEQLEHRPCSFSPESFRVI